MKITLKNLRSASTQQVFEQVATHLLTQKVKSIFLRDGRSKEVCMYRGPEGTMCAAGCLIGDDEYQPHMETYSWRTLVDRDIVPATHNNIIQELQTVHDSYSPSAWYDQLLAVATMYHIDVTFMRKFAD